MSRYHLDERLIEYAATDRQREILEHLAQSGSQRATARALGVSPRRIQNVIDTVRERATLAGDGDYFPPNDKLPSPLSLKGVSKLTKDADGNPVWVKSTVREAEAAEQREAFAREFWESQPRLDAPPCDPGPVETTLIPWFQIGDAHLGMVAWAKETGHNFDLDIGSREILAAFKYLVDKAPKTRRCVINDLGDFTHYENWVGETEASGHRLDIDGRFPKMIEVVGRVLRGMIDYALQKYEIVDVIINQGNHSRTNDIHFRVAIDMAYGHTGRVNALDNSSKLIPYKMGNTFVVTHHSDKATGKKLADGILTTYSEYVRECDHLYADTGHIHHRMVSKEYGLLQIESWNNLSPNDEHHHAAGWRSKQSMSCVIRSTVYGEMERFRAPVEMVWDNLQKALGDEVRVSRPKPSVFIAA